MLKGLGKFSLLLAGAALVVVSCGQGPREGSSSGGVSQAGSTRAEYTYTPEELGLLNQEQTQQIVRSVRLNPNVVAAARDIKGIDWDKRAFAAPTQSEGEFVLTVGSPLKEPESKSGQFLAVRVQKSRLGYDILDVGVFELGSDTPLTGISEAKQIAIVLKHYLDRKVHFVEKAEIDAKSGKTTYYDWGVGEVVGFHHPEIPQNPPTCAGSRADDCLDELGKWGTAQGELNTALNSRVSEWGIALGGGSLLGGLATALVCGTNPPGAIACGITFGVGAGVGGAAGFHFGKWLDNGAIKNAEYARDNAAKEYCRCVARNNLGGICWIDGIGDPCSDFGGPYPFPID